MNPLAIPDLGKEQFCYFTHDRALCHRWPIGANLAQSDLVADEICNHPNKE
jgi:hypothetical protein